MRKILVVFLITLSAVVLQACKAEKLVECPVATPAEWNAISEDARTIVNGYGAVYDTYIKIQRRGTGVIDSKVCEMSRIYCPDPNSDKGCQIFTCDYAEPSNAVLKTEDYRGTKFYNVPVAGRMVWDGYTLSCAGLSGDTSVPEPKKGLSFDGQKLEYEHTIDPGKSLKTSFTASEEFSINIAFKNLESKEAESCKPNCIKLSLLEPNGDVQQWGSSWLGVGFTKVEAQSSPSQFLISHKLTVPKTIIITVEASEP